MSIRLQQIWIRNAPALILAASAIVLGSAMASQYWGGLTPCKLCIWQRWPYVATIAAALLALSLFRGPAGRRIGGRGGAAARRAALALAGGARGGQRLRRAQPDDRPGDGGARPVPAAAGARRRREGRAQGLQPARPQYLIFFRRNRW